MARIKIADLPGKREITEKELKEINGGIMAITRVPALNPSALNPSALNLSALNLSGMNSYISNVSSFLVLQNNMQMQSRRFQILSNALSASHNLMMSTIRNLY